MGSLQVGAPESRLPFAAATAGKLGTQDGLEGDPLAFPELIGRAQNRDLDGRGEFVWQSHLVMPVQASLKTSMPGTDNTPPASCSNPATSSSE
uniref:Uncharacterized protein n=1 Tax=Mycena chlorophos TaxID=658473 RepID=A0ABQ0M1N6_MYCCL|nr:predicted protein [Mycena chlorophos]